MRSEYKIITCSLFFAIVFWAIGSALEHQSPSQERFATFGLLKAPPYQILVKILAPACFVFLGAIAASMLAMRKRVEAELRDSREQLRDFAAYLQAIREEERIRIAREVHDQLGQTLTALKIGLFGLRSQPPTEPETLRDRAESMSELVDTAVQTVQKICTELRPGILDDFGLPAAVEWQTRELQKRTGIVAELQVDQGMVVGKDISTAVFRVFQEALTNVARHACATELQVSLKLRPGEIMLEVKDNGKGISTESISDRRSLGLVGMRERAYSFGGRMDIKGIPGEGTTVSVRFPYNGSTG